MFFVQSIWMLKSFNEEDKYVYLHYLKMACTCVIQLSVCEHKSTVKKFPFQKSCWIFTVQKANKNWGCDGPAM